MTTYKKLDPAFKTQFLKVLRTPPEKGGYYQTREMLRSTSAIDPSGPDEEGDIILEDTVGHCCLGVACDILDKDIWDKELLSYETSPRKWVQQKTSIYNHQTREYKYDHHSIAVREMSMPPKEVWEKIGLSAGAASKLAGLNDGGKSFREIANWIEQNL